MIKMKYKGRTFNNARSLADAMARDMNQQVEQGIRRAATSSGVRIRKTIKGFEVEGDAAGMQRFQKRLKK